MKYLATFAIIVLILQVGIVSGEESSSKRSDIIQYSKSADQTVLDVRIKKKLEWLSDQKFGALVSWGPCVEWGGVQSWLLSPEKKVRSWARPDTFEPWILHKKDMKPFSAAYFDLYKQFDPRAFDSEKLAKTLKQAGVRYAGLTTKHHDGFCMFDTLTTDFKITSRQSPYASHPKADITADLYNSLRKEGLGTLCYFSKSDWHTPYYWNPQFPVTTRDVNYDTQKHPDLWNKFKEYTYRQIKELMSNYGKMDILWLDGGQVRPPRMNIDMERIASMARSNHPDLLIVDRRAKSKYENYVTPEQHVPKKPINTMWEACATIQKGGWVWHKNANFHSQQDLVHRLIRIVSDGGNYLIGIGPDADGRLQPEVEERLMAMGKWLTVNGEGIYNTRRGDFKKNRVNKDIVYTLSKDGQHAYMHLLAWPKGFLTVNSPIAIKEGSDITMLGHETPLKWELKENTLIVDLSGFEKPCKHAWVFKLTLEKK
ncbi:MAG: alpha-L-fucosidase [Pontiella sp.]